MSDLPIQPEQAEIDQFPAMPEEPVFAPDNTDHPDVAPEKVAAPATESEAK